MNILIWYYPKSGNVAMARTHPPGLCPAPSCTKWICGLPVRTEAGDTTLRTWFLNVPLLRFYIDEDTWTPA